MFSTRTLVIKARPHKCSRFIRSFCTSKGLKGYHHAAGHFPCSPGRSKASDTVQTRAQDVKSTVYRQVDTTINLREQRITRPNIQQDLGSTRGGRSYATISYTVSTKGRRNIEDTITYDLESDLLSGDPRWSILPARAHSTTMAALTSLIVPGVLSSPHTVNTVRSLDNQPPLESNKPCLRRQAIVLDCEMVGVGHKGSISALARLSAIDFLTGELLIDKLVQPTQMVVDWRTKYSGITAKAMQAARDSGEILEGDATAREMLSRHMDDETVLIGHALYNDLEVLGIQHEKVVDSASLVEAAVGHSVRTMWGLKKVCKELLGIDIQDAGKKGHDSVEDALAAREVVLWCMEFPKVLQAWGANTKKVLEAKELEAKKKQELESKIKKELKAEKVEAKEVESNEVEAKEVEAKEVEAKEVEAKEVKTKDMEAKESYLKNKKELKAKEVEAHDLEAQILSAKRKIELAAARTMELAAIIKEELAAKPLTAAICLMHDAARKVARESEWLQTFLARRRVLEAEVDSFLRLQTLLARRRDLEAELDSFRRMSEQTKASSAKPETMPTSMSKQKAGQTDMTGADMQCVQGSKPLVIRRIAGVKQEAGQKDMTGADVPCVQGSKPLVRRRIIRFARDRYQAEKITR
jgi:DNA polymerase III epsilon subunit-like protein